MKKITGIILLILCSFNMLSAQKPPMKYGKPDKADLEMKVYAPDSSASAVLLCNYGYFDSNNLQFVHQMRIKILKDEGKAHGNFWVPAAEKTNVKGQTVNLENGMPVVTKLTKDGIFIEKVTKDVYRARVAMPNVKVGSVIDVEFYYQGLPSFWAFQDTYPVRWSELNIEPNSYFSFRKNFTGYTSLSESSDNRWVAKDVPAFKTEPFINNYKNYLTRFNIELLSIHVPGVLYKDIATTWEDVSQVLRDDDDFGGRLSGINFFLNGLIKEIKESSTTPEDKMLKAYNAIKKVKWDDEESIWASKNGLSYCLNKKIGNVADINLMLVDLLRGLNIKANPVVLSTRDNGILPPYSVSLNKFNYILVQAKIGDKTYLLDGTEENLPLGLVPIRAINGKGLIIKKDSIDWVDLTPQKKDKDVSILNLKLSDNATMKGQYRKSYIDYGALIERTNYKKFNSQDEFIKSIESKYNGLTVDDVKLINLDSIQKPLQENFNIVLKNRITKVANQLFISPFQFDRYSENPFKMADRVYPVDFVTPIDETQIFNLELPEGYSIEKLPANVRISLPDNTAGIIMQSAVNDNKIQILFKLLVNKPVFYQAEYANLRAFFDELVKEQSEMLVINKKV